ncbi:MAG: hypothetical protein Kow00124_16280 [Anaerolineae bacterium]
MAAKTEPIKRIGVAELIAQVKHELLEPRPDQERPMFLIREVEVEIAFTVERSAGGKISLQVVEGGATVAGQDVQRVRVTLEPLNTPNAVREQLRRLAEGSGIGGVSVRLGDTHLPGIADVLRSIPEARLYEEDEGALRRVDIPELVEFDIDEDAGP